jgi:hypothetical protein
MKKLVIILLSAGITLVGCTSSGNLNKEEALQILKKELNYPKVVDFDIYCSDPAFAKKLLDAGLETNGIVTIQKTQKLKDAGSPLVLFPETAHSYLLPTPEKDKALDIQKVKIADEEINNVQINSDPENKNTVWVEYTTIYKNITPFSVLLKKNLNEPIPHKVQFLRTKDGWMVQKAGQ